MKNTSKETRYTKHVKQESNPYHIMSQQPPLGYTQESSATDHGQDDHLMLPSLDGYFYQPHQQISPHDGYYAALQSGYSLSSQPNEYMDTDMSSLSSPLPFTHQVSSVSYSSASYSSAPYSSHGYTPHSEVSHESGQSMTYSSHSNVSRLLESMMPNSSTSVGGSSVSSEGYEHSRVGDSIGSDINVPDGAKLFVFHIPLSMTNIRMVELFQPYGTLRGVQIKSDEFGKNRGFGFVSYDSVESAERAIKALHGHQIGDKWLKVEHKKEKVKPVPLSWYTQYQPQHVRGRSILPTKPLQVFGAVPVPEFMPAPRPSNTSIPVSGFVPVKEKEDDDTTSLLEQASRKLELVKPRHIDKLVSSPEYKPIGSLSSTHRLKTDTKAAEALLLLRKDPNFRVNMRIHKIYASIMMTKYYKKAHRVTGLVAFGLSEVELENLISHPEELTAKILNSLNQVLEEEGQSSPRPNLEEIAHALKKVNDKELK